jgi:hypothetical protein
MNEAKIRLSPEEMGLLCNAEWILTKNSILQKGRQLLASIADAQRMIMENVSPALPEDILRIPAKISKGENYQGLPYLILDQPRYFGKGQVFAIRTMLWWGRMFSITLHLTGSCKAIYGDRIANNFAIWKENDFSICIHEEEWEHHFETDNYVSVSTIGASSFSAEIGKKGFIKLAKKIPLEKWDEMQEIGSNTFMLMLEAIGHQLPKR